MTNCRRFSSIPRPPMIPARSLPRIAHRPQRATVTPPAVRAPPLRGPAVPPVAATESPRNRHSPQECSVKLPSITLMASRGPRLSYRQKLRLPARHARNAITARKLAARNHQRLARRANNATLRNPRRAPVPAGPSRPRSRARAAPSLWPPRNPVHAAPSLPARAVPSVPVPRKPVPAPPNAPAPKKFVRAVPSVLARRLLAHAPRSARAPRRPVPAATIAVARKRLVQQAAAIKQGSPVISCPAPRRPGPLPPSGTFRHVR